MKTFLLIDNSNTRTKFMLSQGGCLLGEKRIIPSADISEESVLAALQGWQCDACVICSVVPASRDLLADILHRVAPCHVLSHQSPHGIDLSAYPDREHLGADRLANVMGLALRQFERAMVIDLGTAITYDVLVQEEGRYRYLGGSISPGLASIKTYLSDKTAQLPSFDFACPAEPMGKNTVQAMQLGTYHAFRGMVQANIEAISQGLAGDCKIVVTGGDAALLVQMGVAIDEYAADITLEGLASLRVQ